VRLYRLNRLARIRGFPWNNPSDRTIVPAVTLVTNNPRVDRQGDSRAAASLPAEHRKKMPIAKHSSPAFLLCLLGFSTLEFAAKNHVQSQEPHSGGAENAGRHRELPPAQGTIGTAEARLGLPAPADMQAEIRAYQSLVPPGCREAWREEGGAYVPPYARELDRGERGAGMFHNVSQRATPPSHLPAETGEAPSAREDPHRAVFLENQYPSAMTCVKCHPKYFEQWRVSAHAYSAISPMFQRFEQTLVDLSRGTVGSFCMRCHSPIATQIQYPRDSSILEAPAVIREGITCIVCHRVVETYGKTHGSRRVEPGDVYAPVNSSTGDASLASALANKSDLKLRTSPQDPVPGQDIHAGVIQFETISRSDFCLSCHQVAVHPGIWLEVVYAQYQAGPAAAKGITCQDCHMGEVPGKSDGYACEQIAEINGKPYGQPRKSSNHMFWGPGYSIAHPGLFPIDEKGERWSPRQWLDFDWQAHWGTEDFERALEQMDSQPHFPAPWDHADERRDGRAVIDKRLQSLARARAGSIAAMEAGSKLEGPFLDRQPQHGNSLSFEYIVSNISEGHNLPTGSLGAQPQVWLNVALVDPSGETVWESGYLDTLGDLADLNSLDVAQGRVPRDAQLLNLQTKFLITNIKGTEREIPVPVNFDVDPIPFLRPATLPVSVLNHPPLIRMEARSIPPLDHRRVRYTVPPDRLRMPGVYRLDARMRSRVDPPYFMRLVRSTPEMINRMSHQILDFHPQSSTFVVR